MKTHEEIKKDAETCLNHPSSMACNYCSLYNECDGIADHIIKELYDLVIHYESRLAQVERERDAAVRAISDAKHYIKDLGAISYGLQQLENWDYSIKKSGVFEENTKEEGK